MRILSTFLVNAVAGIALLPAWGASSEPVTSGSCDQSSHFYVSHGYQVRQVRIESPFDYMGSVRSEMRDALAAGNTPENAHYSTAKIIQGSNAVRKRLNEIASTLDLPITINVVVSKIENCKSDTNPPTLDVAYVAVTSWFPFYFSQTYESRASDVGLPSASGIPSPRFQFIPQAGYNATSKLSGGARTTLKTKAGSFEAAGLASPSALSFEGSDSFSHVWKSGFLNSMEWRSGFRYEDAATDAGRNKEARLTTQIIANSAKLSSSVISFRFGAALGGGHDQSSLSTVALPSGTPLNSPAGELKFFAGVTGETGAHDFKFSYGLQLGQAQSGAHVDFAKHLVDAGYDFHFLPWPHRSIDLDTRLTAGWIQDLGAVPVAERFFGGNRDGNFLLGDSWQIRSGPFIRSIPENRLSRLAPDAPIGGMNFVSGNLTLGITTWHRPLLPNEIGTNADFRQMLSAQLNSAQKTLESYWVSKDPAVLDTLKASGESIAAVRELRKQFDSVSATVPDALSDRFSDCDFQVTLAEGFADDLEHETNVSKRFMAISGLAAKEDDGSIDNLVACINDLRSTLGETFSTPMLKRLSGANGSIRAALTKLDRPVAEKRANRDMAFVRQTVNTLVDRMNFFSISPIATFDFAHIGPQASDAGGGFRFGIGAGARFTLLDTIRLDAGYAVNPHPKPWEGRGAAFFSMDILSLFR